MSIEKTKACDCRFMADFRPTFKRNSVTGHFSAKPGLTGEG